MKKNPSLGLHEQASRKRDNIIREVRASKPLKSDGKEVTPAGYEEALALFDAYLGNQRKKRTPERLFILRQVYRCQTPIDIQTLHRLVCEEQGMVSLTTVYNNLSLLIDAQLVRRLDLVGGHMAFFEKVLGQEPHGYAICDVCGGITPLYGEQLGNLQQQLPRGFRVRDVIFHVHGLCHKCDLAARKQAKSSH